MEEFTFKPDLDMNVPVAYAVYKVVLDKDGRPVDTLYVYSNKAYCEMVGRTKEELIGHTFRSVYDNADEKWFDYCYEAAVNGKRIRDRMYSREVGQWLEFEVEPAGEGLAAFIFLNVDMDHVERMNLLQSSNTDDIIIRLAKIMDGGESYEKAVNHMLSELGSIIHPDRLYVLETDGKMVSNTFEWCREGVQPEIHTLQNLPYDEYIGGWEKFLMSLEYNSLPNTQVQALLKSPSPLADVFAAWEDRETSYMEEIWQTVTGRAKEETQKFRNAQKER